MQLKLERFGLPNKPTGTPEQLKELVRCGDGKKADQKSTKRRESGAQFGG